MPSFQRDLNLLQNRINLSGKVCLNQKLIDGANRISPLCLDSAKIIFCLHLNRSYTGHGHEVAIWLSRLEFICYMLGLIDVILYPRVDTHYVC